MTALTRVLFPLGFFLIAFWLVPWQLLDGLNRIAGAATDMSAFFDDTRLNNYFLENIWQFLNGHAPSLWHLPFFYPFPWVLGLSDNLFGAAPVYLLARAFGVPADTSFQIWFLFGFAANYAAAYYALRRLGGSVPAATVGALIFAFALPTMAHARHAQLHYRFGVPLALVFFAEFLHRHSWKALLVSLGWVVWQFYAGIYIGFFLLLFLALMIVAHAIVMLCRKPRPRLRDQLTLLALDWNSQGFGQRATFLIGAAALLALMVVLFYPYLQVQKIYGTTRHWTEISWMLPRPQSYVLSDRSLLWSPPSIPHFDTLPMRHEHQMFIGLVPMLLALGGLIILFRFGQHPRTGTMAGAMGLMILVTLYIGGLSIWYLIHWMPLASAIRAMTRFDQVLLFPVGALAMIGLDYLRARFGSGLAMSLTSLIAAVAIAEMSLQRSVSGEKADIRERMAFAKAQVPDDLPDDAILFMAQQPGPITIADLEAMWIALDRGIPTLNGYSGMSPPGATFHFGRDCFEHSRRLLGYHRRFGKPLDEARFTELAERVVFVGFDHCDRDQLLHLPPISFAKRPYTPEEVGHISYEFIHVDIEQQEVRLRISSTADFVFASQSETDRALRLSWRFLDSAGKAITQWDDQRLALVHDIPPHGTLEMDLPLRIPHRAHTIEASMVQEHVFWLFDVGVPPARAALSERAP